MRTAHVLRCLASAGWLVGTSWLYAQTPASAPAATDPDAPTSALRHPPLASSGSMVDAPGDWQQANAAVAAFTRGHADVMAWEKAQMAAPAAPGTPAEPAAAHRHGGQP
ncbi:hypothetical protein M2375_000716 [Comamonas sp. BIGb0152]|uniref:hypothetical protein n=1 Tax=Comamonas sp. BIGb0152 TaxID=2940601 RepID=UPI002167C381|nr:hypothetical protein [Comamonas sp. BIGb0152]MCS4292510.1 hypothetical protein [Comamonas sp. BIGb0152]